MGIHEYEYYDTPPL